MNLEGFCSGMGEGRSLAIDSQECVNFYPEIHGQAMYGQMVGSAIGKAKAPIVLIGTPGLKLFANFEPVVSVELPPLVCIRDFESGNTGNDIVLTTDGIYWTPHDSKLGDIAPFEIFWDGLQFVFYGDNGNHSDWPYGGVIATSPDGKVWNSVVYHPPEVGSIMKRIINILGRVKLMRNGLKKAY